MKIGIAAPCSGPRSTYGELFIRAVKQASDECAQTPEWVYADDAATPDRAEQVAKELAASNVMAVIGHFNSECANRAIAVYQQKQIPLLAPASTRCNLTTVGNGWLYRLCPTDEQQVKQVLQFVQAKKVEHLLIIHDDSLYGTGLTNLLLHHDTGAMTITVETLDRIEQGASWDMADAIFFAGSHYLGARLVKSLRAATYHGLFIASDDSKVEEFIELAEAAAESVYVIGADETYEEMSYLAAKVILHYLQETPQPDLASFRTFLHGENGVVTFTQQGERAGVDWSIWKVVHGRFDKE